MTEQANEAKQVLPPGLDSRYRSVHAELNAILVSMDGNGIGATVPVRSPAATRKLFDPRIICTAVLLAAFVGGALTLDQSRHRGPGGEVASLRSVPASKQMKPTGSAAGSVSAGVLANDTQAAAGAVGQVGPSRAARDTRPSPVAVAVARTTSAAKVATSPEHHASQRGTGSPQASAPPTASAECSPPDGAWCLREATAAADRSLREAYGRAVDAKVDRATLQVIKRRWVQYRRQANKRPRELLRGYAGLTADLNRIVGNARTARAGRER